MTKTEFMANRDVEIYEKFCAGSKYKDLMDEYDLSWSRIKVILADERKRRGLKKERGKRQ